MNFLIIELYRRKNSCHRTLSLGSAAQAEMRQGHSNCSEFMRLVLSGGQREHDYKPYFWESQPISPASSYFHVSGVGEFRVADFLQKYV